jgi:hypothetical protein
MLTIVKTALLGILLVGCLGGCYRMPTDEDYCLIPSTNNRDFTRESPANSLMPGVGY